MGRLSLALAFMLALGCLVSVEGFRKKRKDVPSEAVANLAVDEPGEVSTDDASFSLEPVVGDGEEEAEEFVHPLEEVERMRQTHSVEPDMDVLDQCGDENGMADDDLVVSIFNTAKIKAGVDIADKLTKLIADGKFRESIKGLASGISPWLGFVGPLIDLLDNSDSAELAYMKTQFKKVISKLDSFMVEFAEVKKLIDWRTTQGKYSDAEQDITALSAYLSRYVGATSKTKKGFKNRFELNYRSTYQASAFKLYEGIVRKRTLSGNLIKASLKYTGNHRRKNQRFMLSLLQLVMQGAQVELSFYSLTENRDTVDALKKEWQTQISRVRNVMQNTDNEIVAGWHDQMKQDLSTLLDKHHQQSNEAFSSTVYNFLADKYDWRYWAVVVTKDVGGGDNHWHGYCGGHAIFRHPSGRNLVVASRLKSSKKRHDDSKAKSVLSNLVRNARSSTSARPENLYKALPDSAKTCSPYMLKSFACYGCDVWYVRQKGTCTYQKMEMRYRRGRGYYTKKVNGILCS